MCAVDEWKVKDLAVLVRRAYPFSELGQRALEATLDMLAGRYPSDEFSELRPRIVWDRAAGTLRGRAGAQRLAVTSGGTIPDRGLFSVNLFDGDAGPPSSSPAREGFAMAGLAAPPAGRRPGRRVGELDEEMVYEMRAGQVFVLGASSWRVVEITQSEVLVVPAPGEPGTVAFWHGDTLGRPVEVGRALGRLTRELSAMPAEQAQQHLREHSGFDQRAASNLVAYLRDQALATGQAPDDRTIVVERFRDQLGDWRICVLTPFGASVHAPWSLAVQASLSERLATEVQSIYTDDGFAIRVVDSDVVPDTDALFFEPEEVRDLVMAQLKGSALFASRFRENAARALLLPRRRPGQRTPLWQQRQRSHDLLQVAGGHPDFPIVIETYRECIADVFALDALEQLMREVRAREVRVVSVQTERASPFAASLMFEYIAEYMYEGAAPLAERRAQALTLDRDLLAELLGSEDLREMLDREAVAALELELQGLPRERWPRDVDEAADVFRRLGDLDADEAAARGVDREWLRQLERERRIVPARLGGDDRWIAVEDVGRYRDALGVAEPPGIPAAFTERIADPLGSLVLRWARTHVPFHAAELAQRWGLSEAETARVLDRMVGRGALLAGEFSPGRVAREYCHADVLRALRRKSLAALRREIEPVPAAVLARFLPAWQGVGVEVGGQDRLTEVIQQLEGAALPVSVLERDILPSRMSRYPPQMLDQLVATGEVVWVGRGTLGAGDGRVALYFRGAAASLVPIATDPVPGDLHARLRQHLSARGASFFRDLVGVSDGESQDAVLEALWDMVWAGEVTNDTLVPLRMLGPRTRRRPSRRPVMRLGPPGSEGRWSLVADLLQPSSSGTERLHAQALALLVRHGVLTRAATVAEGVSGGFAGIYPVLRAMEEAGKLRRGYFVDGLGGSQFALPGAVDRLRSLREPDGRVVATAATDPANVYGVTVPWPEHSGRPSRTAGAFVVLQSGELRLYLERGGRSLLTFGEVDESHLAALATAASRVGKVEVRTVDGAPVAGSKLEPGMREVGFGVSPRGLVLWPERRAIGA
jgi:ATP-dependent Lhr-like helicase